MRTGLFGFAAWVTVALAVSAPAADARACETDGLQQLRADIPAYRHAEVVAQPGPTDAAIGSGPAGPTPWCRHRGGDR
mgnify:CR=1 FL=1